MTSKPCTKCGENKPAGEFFRDKAKADGLRPNCKACSNAATLAWREANADRVKAQQQVRTSARAQDEEYRAHAAAVSASWRAENPDRQAANNRAWQEANRDYANSRRKERSARNPGKAYANTKAWRAANPERTRLLRSIGAAARRAAKSSATPPWADQEKINAIYAEAHELAALGVEVHVDHYYPLKGKTVSGLHAHNNLRVMLAADNVRKSNRMPEEFDV